MQINHTCVHYRTAIHSIKISCIHKHMRAYVRCYSKTAFHFTRCHFLLRDRASSLLSESQSLCESILRASAQPWPTHLESDAVTQLFRSTLLLDQLDPGKKPEVRAYDATAQFYCCTINVRHCGVWWLSG